MPAVRTELELDEVPIIRLESDWLQVDVAPTVGGRIVSLMEKEGGHEFLWRNQSLRLELLPSGAEYDPNFYGGVDELLPNDIPEVIDGIECPDHGELWTTPLKISNEGDRVKMECVLPKFGLHYERWMCLRTDSPVLDLRYRLTNLAPAPRHFLWKLHAALAVQAGDVIECPAAHGKVVDPKYSRFTQREPFPWPHVQGVAANEIPPKDNTMDFFYLSGLESGRIAWHRPGTGLNFAYEFDTAVFPFAWLFASYGGFLNHYTVIIEPCTTVPMSVNDAIPKGTAATLDPGAQLETTVTLRATRDKAASDRTSPL